MIGFAMGTSRANVTLALLLSAFFTGGLRAAGAEQPASRPAITAEKIVGLWQCLKTPDGDKPNAHLNAQLILRPDQTYSQSFESTRYTGTWDLNGQTVTLHPTLRLFPRSGVTKLNIEQENLVDRPFGGDWYFFLYEKKGPVPKVVDAEGSQPLSDLLAEVNKDRAAARKKYEHKQVEVTAVVVYLNENNVYVESPPADEHTKLPTWGTPCFPVEAEPWASVARGQKVKVKGWFFVTRGGAEFHEAVIALDGPPAFVKTSADDLAKECAKDAAAAKRKYTLPGGDGRSVILTGRLLEKRSENGKASALYLGAAGARVLCDFGYTDEIAKTLANVQEGAEVKLAGEVDTKSIPGPTVRLETCRLISR